MNYTNCRVELSTDRAGAAETHAGDFWGVRDNGRLIAMAGERLKLDGMSEVSGVCTHPDLR